MKKALANVEKEWNMGAVAGVKEELSELKKLCGEIERVIKNQLYHDLRAPAKEQINEQNSEGRGIATTS
jgi:hypothetical protein